MSAHIKIVDIYWERIYLHIRLEGMALQDKIYFIESENGRIQYPLKFNVNKNELVFNVTNVHEQQMLANGKWFIKYAICNNEACREEYEGNHIPLALDVCYKLADLDKIYRYSNDNYAYIFSFENHVNGEEIYAAIHSTFTVKNQNVEKINYKAEAPGIGQRIRKILIGLTYTGMSVIYNLVAYVTPKNGKNILLMSETRAMGGNLKALDTRLRERGLDRKFKISHYFCKTLESSEIKILFNWIRLAILSARQDYIFVDDYVPFFKHIKIHPKTKFIQVWHAGVGFKSVGYARFGCPGTPHPINSAHRKYDYVIVGGESLREVYAEVFGVSEEKCLPLGLMRNDGYLNEEKIQSFKEGFYCENPDLVNKKIILFAPTFRGKGQAEAHYLYEILEQDKIAKLCGDEYIFAIKMHPFVRERIKIKEEYRNVIREFSDYPDINELFYVTDLLITDYSSNVYEYSMHRRPVLFFAYDKEQYELIHGVHRTLDECAPGKVCTTLDEMIQAIETEDFEMEKLEKYIEENISNLGGNAADKVIEAIFGVTNDV